MQELRFMVKTLRVPICGFFLGLTSITMAQCATAFTQDSVTIYHGYEPLACTDLEPWVTGNAPFSYVWSTAATVPVILVCEPVSGWYSVTTTDADGCVSGDSVFVNVVDVRCGNTMNKVAVCHVPPGNPANAHTICISENGVPAHLAHGCLLGACAADTADADSLPQSDIELLVTPNPMAENASLLVMAHTNESVRVTLVDAMGRTRQQVFSGTIEADVPMRWSLVANELGGGLFWVRCTTESGKQVSSRVLRIR